VVASVSKGGSAEVVRPPPSAAYFRLTRVFLKGEGKGKKAKVTGEPLPDGTVPDRWDVGQFSPAAILQTFGPDKYRVDWFEADDTRLGSRTFAVATPTQAGSARIAPRPAARTRSRARDEDLEPDDEPRRAREPDSISFREWMAMQAEERREAERREERADERRRQEAAVAQQRDREFMAMVLGTLQQQRATPVESNDLLRRELSLELRQHFNRLREELGGEEPDDGPDEPASIEGVGQAILGELESRAPHLVSELLPQVGEWLKTKGFVPSAELQQALAQRTANGRAGQS
jgi:hypothetical protein